jgi:hypothetical protein
VVPARSLYEAIGAVVAATTALEFTLAQAVSSLTNSPLTSILVQGERGGTLVRMCQRLLKDGIGSSAADQQTGRTERLKLLSHEETERFLGLLTVITKLMDQRDHVVHSMWVPVENGTGFHGQRITRSRRDSREWTLQKLWQLRQDLANATHDIFTASWNATSQWTGLERIEERQGDVQ